jgi:hypothetical protein
MKSEKEIKDKIADLQKDIESLKTLKQSVALQDLSRSKEYKIEALEWVLATNVDK